MKRTRFSRGKDYSGDYFRLLHLPEGGVERLPNVPDGRRESWPGVSRSEFHLLRRISPDKQWIIAANNNGLSLVPLANKGASEIHSLNAPAMWGPRSFDGDRERVPAYYASDLQFALNGRVVVASDLASEWCSDQRRCEEWHLFVLKTEQLTRIHTDTSHMRVMLDGFYAYAIAPIGIHWLWWPFRNAFETFPYPEVMGSWHHVQGLQGISVDTVAFSCDQSRLFLGDDSGRLHFRDLKHQRYEGWQTIDAHAGKITRVFCGLDSRFVVTVGKDGTKVWRTVDMTQECYWKQIQPHWLSNDLRFLVEKNGAVWEIEWEYNFGPPADLDELARWPVETFLRARHALAELSGETSAWDNGASEALGRELAQRGCGFLSLERINSLLQQQASWLLKLNGISLWQSCK